jgi:hypothetical protein
MRGGLGVSSSDSDGGSDSDGDRDGVSGSGSGQGQAVGARNDHHFELGISPLARSVEMTWVE